jgi:hypothetical protein
MIEFQEYAAHGWRLCDIARGRKAPLYNDWNTPEKIAATTDAAEGLDGAGLCHADSGTCAIDLDNIAAAKVWLAERDVDLDGLLNAQDAVRIESGKPGRSKLLYRMRKPLRTIQPRGVGIEFRCATADGLSMQDVLPPTLHPETRKPYRWVYGEELIGDWRRLPPIPAGLLHVWRAQIAEVGDHSIAQSEDTPAGALIALERLEKLIFKNRDPDMEYPDWIKVGMQLHHEGSGSQEAFDIWKRWSMGATRTFSDSPPGGSYPGEDALLTHWSSFESRPGKVVVTGGSLIAEENADSEEFSIVDPVAAKNDPDSTDKKLKENKAKARDAAFARLEDRLVYVYDESKYFDCERHAIIPSDNAIEHMFTSWMPRNKVRRINPVDVLKESATKRCADHIGFHPGEGVLFSGDGDKFANLYRNRLPEPLEPTEGELERIQWLFDRLDDGVFRNWLLDFYSHVVQYPGVKIRAAPLIWSDTQGNGKTTLMKMIPALLVGARYSREVTCALLNSDFNDYLLKAWHVNLTEFRAGTRGEREAITERLKPWISDPMISIHPKGSKGYDMPNIFFMTAGSNRDDAANVDNEDRRWAVHEMHAARMTPEEVSWIYDDFLLTDRASAVLRHYFLNRPIADFNPNANAPETKARAAMIAASTTSDIELLQFCYEERSGIFEKDIVLTHEVVSYVHKHSLAKPSAHRLGRLLCREPFNGKAVQFRVGKKSFRAIVLFNKSVWGGSSGKAMMDHITGDDVDITV